MRKNTVVVGLLVLLALADMAYAQEITWQEIARGISEINTVLVQPDNPRIIYLGAKNGIFKSENAGETWRNILSVRGSNGEVNFLAFALGNRDYLYAATGNGLFYSSNQGGHWQRIFKGRN